MSRQSTAGHDAGDFAGIRQAALDYMQGWYEGDAKRMRRSLHPELSKRAVLRDPQTGAERFNHMTQQEMVVGTQQGGGTDTPADKRRYEVSILDIYGDIACARAESYGFVDYLHLARSEGKWVIVNVLYARKTAT
jgi:hypothetical protein